MPYACRIEADSVNESGDRLTTFVCTYPRMIHSEVLTHRSLSRNSSSSRAIPSEKLIEQVLTDPAMPVWWGKNQKGMQAREELAGQPLRTSQYLWLKARDKAVEVVRDMLNSGLHKQICNRVLEPWMWITVIISATEYENFFALRCHEDAQPEIRRIAEMMQAEYRTSEPIARVSGEWHLPFIDATDILNVKTLNTLRKLSVARCARVSYLTHDGVHDPAADLALHDRLAGSVPPHMSPFEHVARAAPGEQSGNFSGWSQYRKQFENESVRRRI